MKNSWIRLKCPLALLGYRLIYAVDSLGMLVYKENSVLWLRKIFPKAKTGGALLSANDITCMRAGPKVKKGSKVVNILCWQLVGMKVFRPLSDLYLTSNGTMHKILSLTPSVNNFCMCL